VEANGLYLDLVACSHLLSWEADKPRPAGSAKILLGCDEVNFCRIPKLFRQDFSANDKSSEPMVKMTNRRIKLGIDWVLKKAKPLTE